MNDFEQGGKLTRDLQTLAERFVEDHRSGDDARFRRLPKASWRPFSHGMPVFQVFSANQRHPSKADNGKPALAHGSRNRVIGDALEFCGLSHRVPLDTLQRE